MRVIVVTHIKQFRLGGSQQITCQYRSKKNLRSVYAGLLLGVLATF